MKAGENTPIFRKVGHACFLVTYEGQSIIFDPWFGTPINFGTFHAYPKMVPPTEKEISSLVAIHISHIHDDHFDKRSLAQLPKHIPVFIAKYKNQQFKNEIKAMGFSNVTELTHGQKTNVGSVFSLAVFPKQPEDETFDSSSVLEVAGKHYYIANDCTHYDFDYLHMYHIFGAFEGAFVGYSIVNPLLFCAEFVDENYRVPIEKMQWARVRQDIYWSHMGRVARFLKVKWMSPYASDFRFLNRDLAHHNAFFFDVSGVHDVDLGGAFPVILEPGESFYGNPDFKTKVHARNTNPMDSDLLPNWIDSMCPKVNISDVSRQANEYFLEIFKKQAFHWVSPMTVEIRILTPDERRVLRFHYNGESVSSLNDLIDDLVSDLIVEYPAQALAALFQGAFSLRHFHSLYLHKIILKRFVHGQMNILQWTN